MLRALYGHPEAGALWEARLGDIMKNLGWSSIPGNGSVYVHAKSKAAMVIYVDDILLIVSPRDTDALWRDLETSVDYKDPAAPLQRYLGALYHFDVFDPYKLDAHRSLLTSMGACADTAVQSFKAQFRKLTSVTSPYTTPRKLVKRIFAW